MSTPPHKGNHVPELINPAHILTMEPDQVDAFLVTLRNRREHAAEQLTRARRRKSETTKSALLRGLEKFVDQLNKKLIAADKALTKAEELVAGIVALRLQYDDLDPLDVAGEFGGQTSSSEEEPSVSVLLS